STSGISCRYFRGVMHSSEGPRAPLGTLLQSVVPHIPPISVAYGQIVSAWFHGKFFREGLSLRERQAIFPVSLLPRELNGRAIRNSGHNLSKMTATFVVFQARCACYKVPEKVNCTSVTC